MATTTTLQSVDVSTLRSFRDLDLNFTSHPIRKDVNSFSNEYAIINSIKNLIFTQHYERPFQPELGSNLRRMLFEQLTQLRPHRSKERLQRLYETLNQEQISQRSSQNHHQMRTNIVFTLNFFLSTIQIQLQ